MVYRKEIDGLRALAVIPVILFHAGFKGFSGGFIGVDIFFVISGYLITSIILNDKKEGKFSIVQFYERRARRILPALFFLILCTLPFAYFWMIPHQLEEFGLSIISTVFFVSNVYFWRHSDYFDGAVESLPLIHTWSLSVEEQFYLIFPIFLILIYSLKRRWTVSILLLIFLISFVITEWGWRNEPLANFYLSPSRAWELMLGSLCAFFLLSPRNFSKLKEPLAWLGAILLILSFFLIDNSTPFPSYFSLLPTVGTALLIMFAFGNTSVGKILSIRPLVFLGLISYSLYLWHQPIFVFSRMKNLGEFDSYIYFLLILLSVLMAYLSWKFIEKPFRNRENFSRKSIFLLSAVFILALSTIGFISYKTEGFNELKLSTIPEERKRFVLDFRSYQAQRDSLWKSYAEDHIIDSPFDLESKKIKILIMGDSLSQDLYMSLRENSELYEEYFDFRWMRLDDKCAKYLNQEYLEITNPLECSETILKVKKSVFQKNIELMVCQKK